MTWTSLLAKDNSPKMNTALREVSSPLRTKLSPTKLLPTKLSPSFSTKKQ